MAWLRKFLIILLLFFGAANAEEFITVKEIQAEKNNGLQYQQLSSPNQINNNNQAQVNPNDYREIDIGSKTVKDTLRDSSQVLNSGSVRVSLRNQLGENIKVKLDEKRRYYLKPYENIFLGFLERKNYKLQIFDASNRFLGVVSKDVDPSGLASQDIISINRFLLTQDYKPEAKPEPKAEIKSQTNISAASIKEAIASDKDLVELDAKENQYKPTRAEILAKRRIKISNLTNSEIRVSIVGGSSREYLSRSWTIDRSLYAPRFLLVRGEPILIDPDTKLMLETDKKYFQAAKDLRIDDEGAYLWIVE